MPAPAPSVLVVGAGPTGLTLAAELARHDVPVRIVERNGGPSTVSKALALMPRTLEVLDLMGAAEPVLAEALPVTGMSMYSSGKRIARVDIAARHTPHPGIRDLPQDRTEHILGERVRAHGVEVEWGTRLVGFGEDEGRVHASLEHAGSERGETEELTVDWLVGCDGSSSRVREALGIPFEGKSLAELWTLIEARVEWDLEPDRMHMFLSSAGVLACFPLPGGTWRLMANLRDVDAQEHLPDPTTSDMEQHAAERGAPIKGLSDPVWSGYFRIQERLAARYRHGRVLLAGDSAHVHSPAGGQGMNTCIQDAHNLAWKLALVVRGRAGDELVDSYEDERRPIAAGVLQRSGGLLRSGTTQNPVMRGLRRALFPIAGRIGPLTARIADGLGQLDIDYHHSAIVVGEHATRFTFDGGPHPGQRARDATGIGGLEDGDRLFDALRGPSHTLLMFAGEEGGHGRLAMAARLAHEEFSEEIVAFWVGAPGDDPPGELDVRALVDGDRAAHRAYGARQPCLYLVRPDGYIAYRGDDDERALATALAHAIPDAGETATLP